MFYVVAYDMPDDRRRTRLFKLMKGFGVHTQFSVFECALKKKGLDKMIEKIRKIIDDREDNIKIYQVCGTCLGQTVCLGNAVLNREEDVIVI